MLTLTKRWKTSTGQVSYRRAANDLSGLGTSTISDIFSTWYTWTPSEEWRVNLRATYVERDSTNEVLRQVQQLVGTPSLDPVTGLPDGRLVAERTGAVLLRQSRSTADMTSVAVTARIQRRLSRNLWAQMQVTYFDQDLDRSSLAVSSDYQNTSVVLGLNYTFAPIRIEGF